MAFFQDFPDLGNDIIIFQDFPGFPGPVRTLHKERMIDGSESPNASWSFDSEIVYYIIISAICSERLYFGQPESRST